jgi:hypothetical protein
MIKLIFSIGIALFSSANAAQEPKISIKGIEIGFSKAEVANITGTQERFARGFRVGGVYGDMALTYGNSGLSLAMFVFNSGNFITMKEAYTEKYKEMKCTDSEVQNAMGAKFEQTTCIYKDSQGLIELVKYMDIRRSSLKIKSNEKIEEDIKSHNANKKDI